jgi:TolB protein
MLKKIFTALTVSVLTLSATVSTAQIVVEKAAQSDDFVNPTLSFKGIRGNSQLSNSFKKYISLCGWFDMTNSNNSDYIISGETSGQTAKLTITLPNKRTVSLTTTISGKNSINMFASKMADGVIVNLFSKFKVKGICATKFAFCVKRSKSIKNIFTSNFDGTNVKQLTTSNILCVEPDWIPNTSNIIYTAYSRSSTSIMESNIYSKKFRRLTHSSGLNNSGDVSPNGKYLAFSMSKKGKVNIFIKNMNGSQTTNVTNNNAVTSSPCWSPDGSQLCFTTTTITTPKLAIINLSNPKIKLLPTILDKNYNRAEAVSPTWNALNQIAYSYRVSSNKYGIAVLDLNTGKNKSIVTATGSWESPSWAPDNRHVICTRTVNSHSSLYIVDTWTKKYRKVLDSPNNLTEPSWSSILY